jgi:hypothetical protein
MDNWELFDLKKDPFEVDNVYNNSANAALISNLKTRLEELKKEYKMDLSDEALKKMTEVSIERRYRVEPAN